MRTTSIIADSSSKCGDGSREPQRRLVTIHHSPLKGDLDLVANGEDVRVVLKPVTGGHPPITVTLQQGIGDLVVAGDSGGRVDAIRDTSDGAAGNVVRYGRGIGDAYWRGAGLGDAVRPGKGDGDAQWMGAADDAVGSAVRGGKGRGLAVHDGLGTGDAKITERADGEAYKLTVGPDLALNTSSRS